MTTTKATRSNDTGPGMLYGSRSDLADRQSGCRRGAGVPTLLDRTTSFLLRRAFLAPEPRRARTVANPA